MTVRTVNHPGEIASRSPFGVEKLIHPITLQAFAQDHWERQPLLVTRGEPTYYRDLLTLDDMDRILSTSSLRSSDLRVVADSEGTPVASLLSRETGGPANGLEALYARYREGATINLTFLHERWEPLKMLCQDLTVELSGKLQTNVYLTPAGNAQGLKPHYDTHDVFVLQVYGSKHWCLYDSPNRLPLKHRTYRPASDGPGPPVREFDLRAGDLLYLPRGTVHAATSKETASCHLTIGFHPVLWADLLRSAVDEVFDQDVAFREGLPLGFASRDDNQDELLARATALLDVLRDRLRPPALVAQARQLAWAGRQPALQGHLLDLESLPGLTQETWVSHRPGLVWAWRDDGDQVGLEFHSKVVRLPASVRDELEYVTATKTFTPADLPGELDEASRLVLVRTLVREGFLTLQ